MPFFPNMRDVEFSNVGALARGGDDLLGSIKRAGPAAGNEADATQYCEMVASQAPPLNQCCTSALLGQSRETALAHRGEGQHFELGADKEWQCCQFFDAWGSKACTIHETVKRD